MTFKIPVEAIKTVWDRNKVAGIVLEGRSNGGRDPIYSHHVSGGTSSYGYPVGFDVKITAVKAQVTLDIVYDSQRTQGGPLPENVTVELDSAGNVKVTPLSADAYREVMEATAAFHLPCPTALATFGASW